RINLLYQRTNDRILVHPQSSSRAVEFRRPLRNKGRESVGKVGPISDSRQTFQFAIEMAVEHVHAARLVDEGLGLRPGARGSRSEALRQRERFSLKFFVGMYCRDEPDFHCASRIQPRTQEHELQRAPHSEQARQQESRALSTREPGSAVSPFEAGALRSDHQVARHRDSETAGRSYPVHRCDKWLCCPANLGDRAVDILDNLLQHFPETRALRQRLWFEVFYLV